MTDRHAAEMDTGKSDHYISYVYREIPVAWKFSNSLKKFEDLNFVCTQNIGRN